MKRHLHAVCDPLGLGCGLLLVVLACGGCEPGEIRTSFGPGADYERFGTTFRWAPSPLTGQRAANPTLDDFLTRTIIAGFAARGYEQVDNDRPDFWLDYSIVRRVISGQSTPYDQGSLVIEVVSARNGKRVWRGLVTARLDESRAPSETRSRVEQYVKRILERFPKAGRE
jgi:hypothetical protein